MSMVRFYWYVNQNPKIAAKREFDTQSESDAFGGWGFSRRGQIDMTVLRTTSPPLPGRVFLTEDVDGCKHTIKGDGYSSVENTGCDVSLINSISSSMESRAISLFMKAKAAELSKLRKEQEEKDEKYREDNEEKNNSILAEIRKTNEPSPIPVLRKKGKFTRSKIVRKKIVKKVKPKKVIRKRR